MSAVQLFTTSKMHNVRTSVCVVVVVVVVGRTYKWGNSDVADDGKVASFSFVVVQCCILCVRLVLRDVRRALLSYG